MGLSSFLRLFCFRVFGSGFCYIIISLVVGIQEGLPFLNYLLTKTLWGLTLLGIPSGLLRSPVCILPSQGTNSVFYELATPDFSLALVSRINAIGPTTLHILVSVVCGPIRLVESSIGNNMKYLYCVSMPGQHKKAMWQYYSTMHMCGTWPTEIMQ